MEPAKVVMIVPTTAINIIEELVDQLADNAVLIRIVTEDTFKQIMQLETVEQH